jgi:L-seryl-tRNA(Ser) seleniumtransferase
VSTRLAAAGIASEVLATESTVGGGSLPEETQPSRAVVLEGRAATLVAGLRAARPAVISRIVDGRVALDLRAILPEHDEVLASAVIAALSTGG